MLRHSADGVDVVQLRELTEMVARITGASVSILPPDQLLQDEFAHPAGPCAHCSHWDDPTRAPCPLRANKSVGDAIRSGTPVVSTCPFGVTQFTVPLLDETETVAYLVGKQLPLGDESARAGIETVGFDQPRLNPDQWEAGLKLIQMAGKAVTASLRRKGLVPLVSGWPEQKADSGQLLAVILEAHSLPDSYVNALQAVPVGPEEGACDTAAVHRQLLELQTVLERDRGRFAMQAVLTLAKFAEFKDPCTHGRSERVRSTAREVARRLGMSDADVQDVEFAAVLHDLGKVVIPDAILKKPGPLTAAEWQIMRQHPEMGAAILSELDVLSNVVPMVRHHQERWDGRTNGPNPGYPDGLTGDAIPLGARILAVVDAYDAMTSDRPYRRSIGEERARGELIGMAGSQFDPAVVKAALEVMESLTEAP